eukprot:scaffold1658_cov115-Isochrysis_galbana.AAC.15
MLLERGADAVDRLVVVIILLDEPNDVQAFRQLGRVLPAVDHRRRVLAEGGVGEQAAHLRLEQVDEFEHGRVDRVRQLVPRRLKRDVLVKVNVHLEQRRVVLLDKLAAGRLGRRPGLGQRGGLGRGVDVAGGNALEHAQQHHVVDRPDEGRDALADRPQLSLLQERTADSVCAAGGRVDGGRRDGPRLCGRGPRRRLRVAVRDRRLELLERRVARAHDALAHSLEKLGQCHAGALLVLGLRGDKVGEHVRPGRRDLVQLERRRVDAQPADLSERRAKDVVQEEETPRELHLARAHLLAHDAALPRVVGLPDLVPLEEGDLHHRVELLPLRLPLVQRCELRRFRVTDTLRMRHAGP